MLNGKTSAMMAKDGIARPRFTMAIDRFGALRLWASQTARGMAVAAEIVTATIEIQIVAHPRARMPRGPVQLSAVRRNSNASRITLTTSAPIARIGALLVARASVFAGSG